MEVKLVDVDSKIPNLALMKLSKYHKEQGNEVGFKVSDPDKVYVSAIFSKSSDITVMEDFGEAEVVKGGSGIGLDNELLDEVENMKPDYSLYPDCDYSLGFTTRGCDRNCGFCIVHQKEGNFRINRHPREFHNDKFDKVKLLDNNILFDKEWFFKVTDWILENNLKVEFNQGLDVRLLDQDIADRLSELDHFKTIKFAWDQPEIEDKVREGIRYLRNTDIDLKQDVQFYVLTNFSTTHEEDYYRCKKLKEWGTNPFIMLYEGGDPFTKKLARWANRKWLFWSFDFEEYDRLSRMERLEVKGFA